MKMIVSAFVLIGFSLIAFLAWASYPWSIHEIIKNPKVITLKPENLSEPEEHPSVIKILTFNLGFLYGKGSEGVDYERRDKAYYEKSLQALSESIKAWGADVVCLQEVDFAASRSQFINQAQYVAMKAGYPYVAEASSWDSNYIPFPYWPIRNNFGRMNSGGAILSKYPLTDHEVVLLEKPKSQPWWYNLFYLHRYFQKVTVKVGDTSFRIVNLHLEAFDKVDRKLQVKKLAHKARTDKLNIIAGDFNMLPSGALKKSKFFNDDDYENDTSYSAMLDSGLLEVVPEIIYLKDENLFFTFPAWAPDRRLDYIWYTEGLKMMKAEVLPSALSDHLPLRASFQIDGPRFNPYSQ